MRKISSVFLMALTPLLVASCLESEVTNNNKDGSQTITVTTGLYVLNNGTAGQADGSLTHFNFEDLQCRQLLNGTGGVGSAPIEGYTKGDTIFVVCSDENAIVAVNSKDFSIIGRMSTTAEMGEEEGASPRHIAGYGDNLYFTTHGGYVGVMSARNLKVNQKYRVGSGPEGLALGGTSDKRLLYVANSDFGHGDGSVSIINLSSGEIEEFKDERLRHPQDVIALSDEFYVLNQGYTAEDGILQDAGLYRVYNKTAFQVVPDAMRMTAGMVYLNGYAVGYLIAMYDNPLVRTSKPTYSLFNTYTRSFTRLSLSGDQGYEITNPSAIAVDPFTGNIIIASRGESGQAGFANMYSSSGQFISNTHFQTGIEPCMIGFIIGTKTVTY